MRSNHTRRCRPSWQQLLAILSLLLAVQSVDAAYLAKGKLDGISLNLTTNRPQISGWACKVSNGADGDTLPPDQEMDVHIYAVDENAAPGTLGALVGYYGEDGNGQLFNGPAWVATAEEAEQCGLNGQQLLRFVIPFDQATESAFAGKRLRAYALCRPGSTSCAPTQIYIDATEPNLTPFFAYRFSAANNPSGWADTTNYFSTWGCRAPVDGINTIRRLNIAPLGSHTLNSWKDSLHADFGNPVGGNPTLYFTGGTAFTVPTFRLEKATFNSATGNWLISEFASNYETPSGTSANDGTADDYVVNLYNRGGPPADPISYQQDGWGPLANKPGGSSKIPSVATTAVGGAYPLIGSGPLGISAIRALHGNSGDLNTRSCIHMNPSLFAYTSSGEPHGLMACLWTGHPDALLGEPNGHPWPTESCAVPGINQPKSAHYVYRYNPNNTDPNTSGWQLDPQPLSMLGSCAEVGTVNYVQGSGDDFLVTRWEGRIDLFDLTTKTVTESILDCTMPPGTSEDNTVNFSEATGHRTQVFFIADPLGPKEGPANGLPHKMRVHDIYIGFRL